MIEENKIEFITQYSFTEEQISKIVTNVYRPILLQEIQADLESSKFSFSIDTSTFAGESLCVIKAKYWTSEETIDGELNLPKLEDKIIHISSIQENSNAQVMLNIVKKNIPEEIFQSNFIGLTHDNAEALSTKKMD